MPTTLTLTDLAVAYGARPLFSGLDLVLADGDVLAVVGPNGAGKTTLMRTLVGELPVEHGSVRLAPPDARAAWLPQQAPSARESLLDYCRRRTGVAAADRALQQATAALSRQDAGSDESHAAALERWLALGGADLEERLPQVCERIGLDVDADRPLGSLSGGQAARACLAAVLLSQYDLLLLDEPTNDLDRRGIEAMVEFVSSHAGPVLLASHDRAFLDLVATDVVELDLHQQQVHHYTGGWSDYAQERQLRRRQAHEAYATYAEHRDALVQQSRQRQEWAEKGRRTIKQRGEPDKHQREKFRARADRQAARASRLAAAADRLAEVEQPRKEWQLQYSLDAGPPSAEVVATLDGAQVRRGEAAIGPLTLTLGRQDRVALVGDNGSGKSTLLAALLGRLELSAGRRSLGSRVTVGLMDQARALMETDRSLLDVVRGELPQLSPADVRTLLAKFGFGAEHVHRPARTLSLGERTRALMATFKARQVNLLVLDEPTNHLDVAAIEQLEQAVAKYDGTLVVVSHDQTLLDRIGVTRVWRMDSGRVTETETPEVTQGPHCPQA